MSEFRWATVTQTSPLRVQLDGDAAALAVTPDSLIDPLTLAVDDRVRVEFDARRVIVHGRPATWWRGYSQAQLDAGQLDTRYYTEAEINAMAVRGILPASVSVSSGSATVAADGTVYFTGVTRVSLNGVFDGLDTDAYDVTGYASNNASAVGMRLRAAGVDAAGSIYDRVANYVAVGTNPTKSEVVGSDIFGYWCPTNNGTTRVSGGRTSIFNPAKATQTLMLTESGSTAAGASYNWNETCRVNNTTIYDGISLLCPTANTMTGWIKVIKKG